MSNPMPEQWSAQDVEAAFARGDVERIAAARAAGQLDAVLNPDQHAPSH